MTTVDNLVRADRLGLWHGVTPLAVSTELLDESAQQVRGEGSWVVDRAGRRFLDARAGMWNVALGYSNDALVTAIGRQLTELPSGVVIRFEQPPAVTVAYADRLLSTVGGDYRTVKLYQSGAQAVEGAILLARYVARISGQASRHTVISLRTSWHGAGVAAGAVTGEEHVHSATGPLMSGASHVDPPHCFHCPWGLKQPSCELACVRAIEERLDALGAETVAAVIVEPVLGTNIAVPPRDYLARVARLCRERGILLIVDEITTGFGRTGAISAAVADGVEADLLLLGKGITGGYLPMSAMLVGGDLTQRLLDHATREGFPHGSTSDGYPLAAAAGLAVLDVFDAGLLDHVHRVAARLRAGLTALRAQHPSIVDVRGRGLMLGVELADSAGPWSGARCEALRFGCEEQGLLLHTGNNVVDFMPPLTLTEAEADEICVRFSRALAIAEAGW